MNHKSILGVKKYEDGSKQRKDNIGKAALCDDCSLVSGVVSQE